MKKLELWQFSSLEKIFLKELPGEQEVFSASALLGEEFHYQITYLYTSVEKNFFEISVDSPLREYITIHTVGNVPAELPAYEHDYDDDYITLAPGLFPDVLYPLTENRVEARFSRYHSFWITVKIPEDLPAGEYEICFTMKNDALGLCESKKMSLTVIGAALPKQKMIYTQWIFQDSIAEYYHQELYSEPFWEMTKRFVRCGAENGINMVLIPIFNAKSLKGPQSVTVQKAKNGYSFDFSNMRRYIELLKEQGIEYFELGHLYNMKTHAPNKVLCRNEQGENEFLFDRGEASLADFEGFLADFLPALKQFLIEEEVLERAYFHIADEPTLKDLDFYKHESDVLKKYLGDVRIMDALSDYEFYETDCLQYPVVAIDHLEPYFGKKNVIGYNCCAQHTAVSNRFMAMPSYRNRIIGVQMYLYQLIGFLHWGFNYYFTENEPHLINPFLITDGENTWQAGDPFSVYPGEDGPIESIRLKVFFEALTDIRALQLLEQYASREEISDMIRKLAGMQINFREYPRTREFLLDLRETVNRMIAERI